VKGKNMGMIFISYRREDCASQAGRLCDWLGVTFGVNQVFMDIDTIGPGADFVKVIQNAVASCNVLIAMIGKNWLTITDSSGRRRLENPDDYVCLEISTALDQNKLVIPLLVQGATMPRSDDLPHPLAGLVTRNAYEISDARWKQEVTVLVEKLQGMLNSPDLVRPSLSRQEELKVLIEEILQALKAGQNEKASKLVKRFILPNHRSWFSRVFGDEAGAKLSAEYEKTIGQLEFGLISLFGEVVKKDQLLVRINRFKAAGDNEATGLQNAALASMKTPIDLYSVRMVKFGEKYGTHLWSFVYEDGAFRFAGKMRAVQLN